MRESCDKPSKTSPPGPLSETERGSQKSSSPSKSSPPGPLSETERGSQKSSSPPRFGEGPGEGFFRLALATIVAIFCCSTLSAASYGDVDVVIETEPSVKATHGYAEMWVRVTNRSKQEAREVRLTLPKHSYSPGEDHLRAVSRTINVEPGKTARVALSYPLRLPISGNGLGVTIDGREQKDEVDVPSGSFRSPSYGRYGYSSTGPQPTVLYSKSIDPRFPDWAEITRVEMARRAIFAAPPAVRKGPVVGKGPPVKPPKGLEEAADLEEPDEMPVLPGARAGGGSGSMTESAAAILIRAESPAANWSPNWLGYSRYDGIVLTAADLRSMPDEVRSAIGQYVECGGSLLVLGKDPQLPGKWKLVKWPDRKGAECEAGFGACFVIERTDLSENPWLYLHRVVQSWSRVLRPWSTTHSATQANTAFPIVDDISAPVEGLLGLMFVFSIVAGPLTLVVLARRGRKLWLFWVVPVISALTCLSVFGYMALREGWSGRSRIAGITILDENTRRASSLGWSAFYSPLSSGGGLHFSPNTEVSFQNSDDNDPRGRYRSRNSSSAALSIDWTGEQHLVSGWMSPRVPAHFIVRKSEIRRERITFSPGQDGRPEAVNGLGADLTELWYADESGNVFHAQKVGAGSKVSLDPAEKPDGSAALKSIGNIYTSDWSKIAKEAGALVPALLKPRTYLAVMESAPFFDEGLQNAKSRRAQSVVIGIIREGGDEN